MPDPFPPGPPKVYAPHRLDADTAPADAGVAGTALTPGSPPGTQAAPSAGQGAVVTASVPGAQAPVRPATPGEPTTSTSVASSPPPAGLARTGADVTLLLAFALAALILGALLVRLGRTHPPAHQPSQGAP